MRNTSVTLALKYGFVQCSLTEVSFSFSVLAFDEVTCRPKRTTYVCALCGSGRMCTCTEWSPTHLSPNSAQLISAKCASWSAGSPGLLAWFSQPAQANPSGVDLRRERGISCASGFCARMLVSYGYHSLRGRTRWWKGCLASLTALRLWALGLQSQNWILTENVRS